MKKEDEGVPVGDEGEARTKRKRSQTGAEYDGHEVSDTCEYKVAKIPGYGNMSVDSLSH